MSIPTLMPATVVEFVCGHGQLLDFVQMVARLETAEEFDERTDGEGMSGDDAVDTVSSLALAARAILASRSEVER